MEKVWKYWGLKLAFSAGNGLHQFFTGDLMRQVIEWDLIQITMYGMSQKISKMPVCWLIHSGTYWPKLRNKPSISWPVLVEKWQQKTRTQQSFLTLSFMVLLNLGFFLSTFLEVGNFKNSLSICTEPYSSGLWIQPVHDHCSPGCLQSWCHQLPCTTPHQVQLCNPSGRAVCYLAEDNHNEFQEVFGLPKLSVLFFHLMSEWLKSPSRMRAFDASCTWKKKVSSIASPWRHSESRKLSN